MNSRERNYLKHERFINESQHDKFPKIFIIIFITIAILINVFGMFIKDDLSKNAEVKLSEIKICQNDVSYIIRKNIEIPISTNEIEFCGNLKTYQPISIIGYVYNVNDNSKPPLIINFPKKLSNGPVKINVYGLEVLSAGKYDLKIYFNRYVLFQTEFLIVLK